MGGSKVAAAGWLRGCQASKSKKQIKKYQNDNINMLFFLLFQGATAQELSIYTLYLVYLYLRVSRRACILLAHSALSAHGPCQYIQSVHKSNLMLLIWASWFKFNRICKHVTSPTPPHLCLSTFGPDLIANQRAKSEWSKTLYVHICTHYYILSLCMCVTCPIYGEASLFDTRRGTFTAQPLRTWQRNWSVPTKSANGVFKCNRYMIISSIINNIILL